MKTREDLQYELEEAIGSTNVYFEPPEGFKLKYPCIIYKFDGVNSKFANGKRYLNDTRYTLTLIDKDPESPLFDKIFSMQHCRFDRLFKADNLSHFVFTLYY